MSLQSILYSLYERRLMAKLATMPRPRHVGVVIDGNRRWARASGLADVSHGHQRGADHIDDLLRWCAETDIELVTLWGLSTDNRSRPESELRPLMRIIENVADHLSEPHQPWRLKIVGALDMLPAETAAVLKAAQENTADRTGMNVNIAVGYGGRQEIADAVRSLLTERAEQGATLDEVAETFDVDQISAHLYTRGQPDPDLLIRTSGEQRLSGFLLWQSAHSEFYFCDAYWPDFRRVDFLRALREYGARHRRYGA